MNELYHHGILGMKWGVRRYQNKDGSLTDKGKQRFKDVRQSERLSKENTEQALNLLTKKKKKVDKKIRKTINKQHSVKYKKQFEEYSTQEKILDKKISDIKTGKLKAGKDFIVQNDYNLYPYMFPLAGYMVFGGYVKTDSKIIEKNKKG